MSLDRSGVAYDLFPYVHDPAAKSYGLEAAAALGLDPAVVFKTLVACLDDDRRRLVVAVVPVSSQLDLKELARVAGAKRAKMASVADAERSSGMVAGGISPFGHKRPLPTFVDETAELVDRMYVSAGQRGLDLAIAPTDLIRLLDATLGPISA